jgi:hypothetical protein
MAKDKDTNIVTSKEQLASIIRAMTYGELISVAEVICKMKRARLETREDFAELLHDWAEGQ